ncbi:MAG: hypothetical protein ACD_52C00144G0001 [uncultured bacterium]|nr:MAG: hypothetical protein ACD_52C00144G0001 [uncultured bacterium]
MSVPADKVVLDNSLLTESDAAFREALCVVEQKVAEYYSAKHDDGKVVTDEEKEMLAAKALSIAHEMGFAAGFQEAENRLNSAPERRG